MFLKMLALIITDLKIPCFKIGANVHTLYELANNNVAIIFNCLLCKKTNAFSLYIESIFKSFEGILSEHKLQKKEIQNKE